MSATRPLGDAFADLDTATRARIAANHDITIEKLRQLASDPTLYVTAGGLLQFRDMPPPEVSNRGSEAPAGPFPNASTFLLHSRPSATRVLYLDFDGYQLPAGTYWNEGSSYSALRFDLDGAPGFNQAEHDAIQNTWQRIAEDYAPFDIDVTTQAPPPGVLSRANHPDPKFGGTLVFTNSPYTPFCDERCGGSSFVGNVAWRDDASCELTNPPMCHSKGQPSWVFTSPTSSTKFMAEAGSHEFGHAMGLLHDGRTSPDEEYYKGHGDWAPIMGVGYDRFVTQWSTGEYAFASQRQDDFGIASGHEVDLAADDAGESLTPTNVLVPGTEQLLGPAWSDQLQADTFDFRAPCSGVFTFAAEPVGAAGSSAVEPNLSLQMSLSNWNGSQIAAEASQPVNLGFGMASMGGSLPVSLVGGNRYALRISPLAALTASTGWTNYANVGRYTISVAAPLFCQPGNNAFALAQRVTGREVSLRGSNMNATKELLEPAVAGNAGGKSVWYTYVAPSDGLLTVDTCSSSFDTLLGVFTGSAVSALTAVAQNDNQCGVQSRVTTQVAAGVTYRIAVDGKQSCVLIICTTAEGNIALKVTLQPTNDAFASAQVIRSLVGSIAGSTDGAGVEPGEPFTADSVPRRSVWYSYTPTLSSRLTFFTCEDTSFDTVLGVYTGTAPNALTQIATNDDACGLGSTVNFIASPGTTYLIKVDGFNWGAAGKSGDFRLRWDARPLNDDFADAVTIVGATGSRTDHNVGATLEPGEPDLSPINPGGQSIWYRYQASAHGTLTLDTCGSSAFGTRLGVYEGVAVGALTLVSVDGVPCGSRRSVTAQVRPGVTYAIQVDTDDVQNGITLNWSLRNHPPNDNFTSAQVISGSSGTVTGTNVNATLESGEPTTVVGDAVGASVWYSYAAPADGVLTVDNCESSFNSLIAVYTGAAVNALTSRAEGSNNGCAAGRAKAVVSVAAGTVYKIAVTGFQGATGNVTLNWVLRPRNDDFVNAHTIGGLSGTATGSNVNATSEPGEPAYPGYANSVWYRYVPPVNGLLSIDTCGSAIANGVGVYTGSAVNALSSRLLAPSGCPSSSVAVVAGTTYSIGVAGSGGATGALTLHWSLAPTTSVSVPWSTAEADRLREVAAYLGTTPEEVQSQSVAFLAFLVGLSGDPTPTPWTPTPLGSDETVVTVWPEADLPLLDTVQTKYAVNAVDAHRLGVYFISFLLSLGGN
jgi:hypothetical protein